MWQPNQALLFHLSGKSWNKRLEKVFVNRAQMRWNIFFFLVLVHRKRRSKRRWNGWIAWFTSTLFYKPNRCARKRMPKHQWMINGKRIPFQICISKLFERFGAVNSIESVSHFSYLTLTTVFSLDLLFYTLFYFQFNTQHPSHIFSYRELKRTWLVCSFFC